MRLPRLRVRAGGVGGSTRYPTARAPRLPAATPAGGCRPTLVPITTKRHGRSAATEMPDPPGGERRRPAAATPSSATHTGAPAAVRSAPSKVRSMPERLAQPARPAAQVPVVLAALVPPAGPAHQLQAVDRLEGPQQDRLGAAPAGPQTTLAHQCTP